MHSAISGAIAYALLLLALPAYRERPEAVPERLPIIDVHLHALAADANGPPPLAMCTPILGMVRDPRQEWPEIFLGVQKEPPCPDPVWSPSTDEDLMNQTLDVMRRRNVIGVLSGTADRVARWRSAAPDRVIPGLGFRLGRDALSPDAIRRLKEQGQLAVLAEVTNQYAGIAPDDPAFEPYLAMAEAVDLPIGIHIGTGPPGAPYAGFHKYRSRLHSALLLEEPLLRHPKLRVYVMHAGWPMIGDLLALLWAHPHVYVEVGGIAWALPRAGIHRYVQQIVDAGFDKRVMFGSDQMVWPGVIERAIGNIESAPFLSESQKRDIFYNNAARFLRLSEEEIARHHAPSDEK